MVKSAVPKPPDSQSLRVRLSIEVAAKPNLSHNTYVLINENLI